MLEYLLEPWQIHKSKRLHFVVTPESQGLRHFLSAGEGAGVKMNI